MSEESMETVEQVSQEAVAAEPEPRVAESTGHPAVDGVIGSLEGIEELPVSEQPPVFEAAHETLRAALADAGNATEA